VVPIYQMGNSL